MVSILENFIINLLIGKRKKKGTVFMWIVDIYLYIYIYYSICGIQALMMVHMGFLFHSFIFYYCGSTVFSFCSFL